jgi:putative tryptophan/tyrosine transport system substrate-binding protein
MRGDPAAPVAGTREGTAGFAAYRRPCRSGGARRAAPRDLEPAFAEITAAGADALIVFAHTLTIANSRSIIALANRQRFPTMYGLREYALEGGLIAYGPRITDSFRRAAYYVDRILKGAKPGDIPIEQPTKFELVVNLKTASAMGLAIPPALLARADEVIE